MPSSGINYTLLHSAASSYLESAQHVIFGGPVPLELGGQKIPFTEDQIETLVRALDHARRGNRAAFKSNPDLVAQAYCILAAGGTFRSHPSASQTLDALRPIASQSIWARHAAGSSGIFGTVAAFTGQLKGATGPKGGLHAIQPDALRGTYTRPDGNPVILDRSPAQAQAVVIRPAPANGTRTDINLTGPENTALEILRRNKPTSPQRIVLITDPNKDPDDMATLLMSKKLEDDGVIRLEAVVTTLGDSDTRLKRAQFAKAELNQLNMPHVKVAAGGAYPDEGVKDHQTFIAKSLLAPQSSIEPSAHALLKQTLSPASNGSITIVIIASMGDIRELIETEPTLFRQKVKNVVIMGGLAQAPDVTGHYLPDPAAYNNRVDMQAAEAVYRAVQEMGIPLVILDKHAAAAAPVRPGFYDELLRFDHPVGNSLQAIQKSSLAKLWETCRTDTHQFLNLKFFFATFTDLDPENNSEHAATISELRRGGVSFDQVWVHITKLNLYDPLALLAATPVGNGLLFRPTEVKEGVYLISKGEIVSPDATRAMLGALAKSSAAVTAEHARSGTAHAVLPQGRGYPRRASVPSEFRSWNIEFPDYKPEYHVDAVVLVNDSTRKPGGWAHPEIVPVDLRDTVVSTTGLIKFDDQGRPLNPEGRTGIAGRGLLGKWGPNFAADPLITRNNPQTGEFEVLLIQRRDTGQWALPGGMVDSGEQSLSTAVRELGEETGVALDMSKATRIYQGYVKDPRNTDHAWMETSAFHLHLKAEAAKHFKPKAGDDAKAARWMVVTDANLGKMYANHADFIRKALESLRLAGHSGAIGYIETSSTAPRGPSSHNESQAEEQLRRAYAAFKGDGARAAEFKTAVEDYLAQELGRRPSEAEVMTHLTETGERSMLGQLRQLMGASDAEFSEVVEKARDAGVLPKRAGTKGDGAEEKLKETPRRK